MKHSWKWSGVLMMVVAAATSSFVWGAADSEAVQLSISNLRGGMTIDLGMVDEAHRQSHEETTITMTNTTGTQYRLSHMFSSSLMNERNVKFPTEALAIELTGGTTGMLRARGLLHVSSGPEELFVSGRDGRSDTIKALYGVSVRELPAAGTYTGFITYTLQTVDGEVDTETVPIRVVVNATTTLTYADASMDRLNVGRLNPGQTSEPKRLLIELRTNLSEPIRLQQLLEQRVVNEQGQELPVSSMHMVATFDHARVLDQPLEPRMTLVRSQSEKSDPVHRLEVVYQIKVPDDQPAGRYRGMLRFLEERQGLTLLCPIELEVNSILALSVEAPRGGLIELTFADVMPGTTSEFETLMLDVRTNTGRTYELFQEVSNVLISDEGRQLPDDALRYKVERAQATGRLEIGSEQPVRIGRTPLYRSSSKESHVRLPLQYRVQIPPGTKAGAYRSTLLFTLTEF